MYFRLYDSLLRSICTVVGLVLLLIAPHLA
jgi:hypothetical protein